MSRFYKGMNVQINGIELTIVDVVKGGKTNKEVLHSGIVPVGYHSKPKVYILSNGSRFRGSTLLRHINNQS
jgi:hypothetical protein